MFRSRIENVIPHRWLLFVLLVLIPLGLIARLPQWKVQFDEWRLKRMSLKDLQTEARRVPGDVRTRYHLAAAYARRDQDELAIPEYVAVLRLKPDHAKALNDLGVILMTKGKNSEALLSLRAAVDADPTSAEARANLGRLYLTLHSPYSATNELTRAAKIDPTNALILCDLGVAHLETMNFKKALEAYQSAARAAPGNPDVWCGLGETYRGLAKVREAKEALKRALKLKPKHARALAAMGRVVFESATSPNEFRAAERLLAQSIKLDSQNSEALYNLGVCRRKLGDDQGAINALEQAIAITPTHIGSLYQLGNAYLAEGRTQESEFVLRRFNTLANLQKERDVLERRQEGEPNNLSLRLRLAELYIIFQEPAAAIATLHNVLKRDPNNARALELNALASRALQGVEQKSPVQDTQQTGGQSRPSH